MIRNIIIVVLIIIFTFSIWKFNADKKKAIEGSTFSRLENELYHIPEYGNFSGDWKSFEDIIGGYSINYPSDWMIESNTENDDMIRADIAKGSIAGFQIRMLKYSDTDFGKYVDFYLEKFKDEMTTHWRGSFSDEINVIENRYDHNFARTSFTFTAGNGNKWFFVEYIWQKEDVIIIFQCGMEHGKKDQYLSIFDSIADSFGFVE